MKTREEIEEQISELVKERSSVDYNIGIGQRGKWNRLTTRIETLQWVLTETKEEPLTQIELKQLRKIMAEHRSGTAGDHKFPFPRD